MTSLSAAHRASARPLAGLLGQLVGALSILWSAGLLAAPKTDVVILTNGDRITGEIKQLERGILTYDTDATGTISIQWELVAQLQSNQLFEVERIDGSKVYGRPSQLGDAGSLVLEDERQADGRRERVDIDHAVRISALDQGRFRERLDGKLNIGWSAAAANAQSQLSLGAGVRYRDEKREWELDYDATTSESESNPASASQALNIAQRRFLRARLFWLGAGSYQSNDELGLDLRLLVAGAIGRYFIQNHHHELAASVGLALTREEFSDGQAQESIEGYVAGAYDLFKFDDPEIDISTSLKIFPSFTVSGRVRTDADVVVSYEFIKDFTYELSLTHTYDSEPQSVGAPRSDWSFFTSLGYEF